MQVPVLSARRIQIGSKTRVIVFLFCSPKSWIDVELWFEKKEEEEEKKKNTTCGIMTCEMNNLEID